MSKGTSGIDTDMFVAVNSFQAMVNYDYLGIGKVHNIKNHDRYMVHHVSVPKGVSRVHMTISFSRVKITLGKVTDLIDGWGYQLAVLPEGEAVVGGITPQKMTEIFQAKKVAADARKEKSGNDFALVCGGSKVGHLTPVKLVCANRKDYLTLRVLESDYILPPGVALAMVPKREFCHA